MNDVFEAALEIDRFCGARGTILAGFGSEEGFIDALLAAFAPRRPDAREFALRSRVLLLRAANGTPVDAALGALPYEERAIARASDFVVAEGKRFRTGSAEDLVILKAFAGRDRDWVDIERIAVRQEGRLDQALIFRELEPLLALKEAPEAAAPTARDPEEGGLGPPPGFGGTPRVHLEDHPHRSTSSAPPSRR